MQFVSLRDQEQLKDCNRRMRATFLKRFHSWLKDLPGFKGLDGLIIAVCFKLAVPCWLKICKLFLWLRLLGIAAVEQKKLVVVARYGAIGDIICTFPAVAELVRQNPGNPVVYVVRRSFKALVERGGLDVRVVAVRNHLELPSRPSRVFKQSTPLSYPGEDGADGHLPGRRTDDFARCLGFAGATSKPSLRVDRVKADALRAEYLGCLGRTERRASALPEPANAAPSRGAALRQPLVLLHGGPTWAVREWPVESWGRLVERLKSELGCAVMQLVAARNITVRNPVCRVIPGAEPVECVDDIDKLIHLVAAVDLLIGIDSGPMHVAGAVGTPCVALFGPTDPELVLFDPGITAVFHRVECSFCHHRHPRLHWQSGCPHDIQCMKGLTVEQVFDAVAAHLAKTVGKP
jgi:heptosyltransferase-1